MKARLGELLSKSQKVPLVEPSGEGSLRGSKPSLPVGINKSQSSRWQSISKLGELLENRDRPFIKDTEGSFKGTFRDLPDNVDKKHLNSMNSDTGVTIKSVTFWVAREILSNPGARTDLVPDETRSWQDYCIQFADKYKYDELSSVDDDLSWEQIDFYLWRCIFFVSS